MQAASSTGGVVYGARRAQLDRARAQRVIGIAGGLGTYQGASHLHVGLESLFIVEHAPLESTINSHDLLRDSDWELILVVINP